MRQEGWYWIKLKSNSKWVIAEYSIGSFVICGVEDSFHEGMEIEEVDENQIVR